MVFLSAEYDMTVVLMELVLWKWTLNCMNIKTTDEHGLSVDVVLRAGNAEASYIFNRGLVLSEVEVNEGHYLRISCWLTVESNWPTAISMFIYIK